MTRPAHEWQFDGLIGPTHNYAGLSFGNLASATNKGSVSNPKQAALQGLEKMRFVRSLGIHQAFVPPRYRPIISQLKRIGFGRETAYALDRCYREAPHLLTALFSSSFMWAANAGTVAPSSDSADGRMHITPANLLTNYHRSLESFETHELLTQIFANEQFFSVHQPLPHSARFSDEGAANHMRVCATGHANRGLHIFVYGMAGDAALRPAKYPARQQRDAFEAISRLHELNPESTFFVQQLPEAIDAGVFHNDVICMNTTRLMITHQKAFAGQQDFLTRLQHTAVDMDFQVIEISDEELPIRDAVTSYFFNSQVLELEDGRIVIVAPTECEENPRAHAALSRLAGSNAVAAVHYRDVRESMRNGGGPACLRLRVVLTEQEAAAMNQAIVLTEEKYDSLVAWVERYYRDRLSIEDFRDPAFINELNEAYTALEPIIAMSGFYTARMG